MPARRAELLRRLDDAERRLADLEAMESIKNLMRTYIRQLADKQWSELPGHFTEDAVMDLRHHGAVRGRGGIEAVYARMQAFGDPHDGYVLSSADVAVDGDRASGVFTWHRFLCEFPVMGAMLRVYGPWWEGRYEGEYVRTQAGWHISRLRFRVVRPDRDLEPEEMQALERNGEVLVLGALKRTPA